MNITPRDTTGATTSSVAAAVAAAPPANRQADTIVDPAKVGTEETETPEALSPRFAELARRQKAIRDQQRAVEAERKQIEADKAAAAAERKEIDSAKEWKQRLAQDPYSVMLESGLTADQVATLMLNQPNPADQRTILLERKIAELESKLGQNSTKFEDMQKQQYADAKKQIRADVVAAVDSDATYETIKTMGAHDAVVELIEQTYKADGRLMTVEEASNEVEEYLIEEGLKMASIGKVKSRLNPEPPAEAVEQKQLNPTQKQSAQTLSNRMTPSTTKPLSSAEKRARAIAAFQGKL